MMYSIYKFQYEMDGKFLVRKYVKLESGMSWQDAKNLRKNTGGRIHIVKEICSDKAVEL